MATLDRHFEKFHSRIALDVSRVGRIMKAHESLRKNVESDGPLSKVLREVFLQGSYAQSTAVRPSDNGEFDVDVVLALDISTKEWMDFPSKRPPAETLEWVASRLRTFPAYAGKVRRKGRCVRVEYSDEFHMDVVPAHAPRGTASRLEVPNRDINEWQESHPKGYLEWCTQRNRVSDGQFTRVTKYLKWWRDHKVAEYARPKSIVLQTLIGYALSASQPSDAQAVAHAFAWIEERVKPNLLGVSKPQVQNPSVADEDLAARWDEASAKRFFEVVQLASRRARVALAQPHAASSAEAWAELFGDGFPRDL